MLPTVVITITPLSWEHTRRILILRTLKQNSSNVYLALQTAKMIIGVTLLAVPSGVGLGIMQDGRSIPTE